jgi:putative transposase
MHLPRVKSPPHLTAVYHCITRTVGGQFLLHPPERLAMRHLMHRMAAFCGITLLDHAILENHLHFVLRTPGGDPPDDQVVLSRVRDFYGEKHRDTKLILRDLEQLGAIRQRLRQRLVNRMGDVSIFMKEFKQRFSRWYNLQHDRFGTLWAERFTSVLVEDVPSVVLKLIAYADLNPVRAGIVTDPADYPDCGLAEAMAEDGPARRALSSCLPGESWEEKLKGYRDYLFSKSAEPGHSSKHGLSDEQIQEQIEEEKPVRYSAPLRYMVHGLVVGSKVFVEGVFQGYCHYFKRRQEGARPVRDEEGLNAMRAPKAERAEPAR